MEFSIQHNTPESPKFSDEVLESAYEFTKKAHQELGTIIRASVLFGSATHKENPNDIDILIIIDDLQIAFTDELQQAYRVIIEKCVRSTDKRLHITTLRFSNFWEYVRIADPIVVTVLRDGLALIDTGFFSPLQLLLEQGRIRPTQESVWAYYSRAPQLLLSSKWKVLQGVIDLYWAAIDSAHAALMAAAVTPQTPEHVPELLRKHFVSHGLLQEIHVQTLEKLYVLQKDIHNRRVETLSGGRFDALFNETDTFVKKMRVLIE